MGIAQGAIIALIALGYTLVYGILRMINFAHGEVFMFGAFAGVLLLLRLRSAAASSTRTRSPSIAIILIVAMLTSMGVAILLERVAYRPLRNAPRLVPLITAIGASLFLQNTARGFFGAQNRGFGVPEVLDGTWTILGLEVDRVQVVVVVTVIVAVVVLSLFIARTRTGKSMRAVAADSEIASLMGIRVDRVVDDHVRDRRSARGHRGRAVLDHVRIGELLDGVPTGDRGVHGGRPRRDREHRGSRARRPHPRADAIARSRRSS